MASIIFKWLRRCLFICVFAFFLMSDNASAVSSSGVYGIKSGSVVLNGRSYPGISENSNSRAWLFDWSSQTAYIYDGWVNSMCVSLNGGIPKGAYFSTSVYFRTTTLNNQNFLGLSSDYNWGIVSQTVSNLDYNVGGTANSNTIVVNITGYNNGGDNSYFCFNPSNGSDIFRNNIANNNLYIRVNPFSWYAPSDSSESLQSINNNLNNVNNSINNINNDVENSTQDAADESADSGEQSAADAENATAGLISVIGGFVNAITSASPSDCKINGKINNSFNMGELDLCSMPVPSFVQIISSLILIAICIPFAIIMFNRFIGLFRSFQG